MMKRTSADLQALMGGLVLVCSAMGAHASDFIVGVAGSINDPAEVVKAAADLGVKSIRIDMPWRLVEETKGDYKIPPALGKQIDLMKSVGIEPLVVFGYGNKLYDVKKPNNQAQREAFAAYALAVTKLLKGQVKYYEIWNEWETVVGGTERGEPETLVALEKLVCPAIKKADPSALILGGGISSDALTRKWFEDYARAGGGLSCSGLALHPYSYQFKRDRGPEMSIGRLEKMRSKLASLQSGQLQDIYVTEVGYPIYTGFGGVGDKRAAAYLPRFYTLAAAKPWVKGVWWYGLRDQGREPHNKEHHFGLYTQGMELKPSGVAMKAIAGVLNGSSARPKVTEKSGQYRATANGGAETIEWKYQHKAASLAAKVIDKIESESSDGDDDDEPIIRKK